jgi:hypothetical protein
MPVPAALANETNKASALLWSTAAQKAANVGAAMFSASPSAACATGRDLIDLASARWQMLDKDGTIMDAPR